MIVKKTMAVFYVLFIVTCFFSVMKAHAAGLGLYASGGRGTADWSTRDDETFKKSTSRLGVGLALDTNPDSDRLFNYNLNIGYERFSNHNGNAWKNLDLNGFVVRNAFGFGGLITPDVRVWFGPQLSLSWFEGSPDSFQDYTIRLFGIGIGPTLGVNFNAGEHMKIVLKGGYQFTGHYGYGQGRFSHQTNDASSQHKYYYDAGEKLFYVAVEFLARTSKGN